MDNLKSSCPELAVSANWQRKVYEALACRGHSILMFGAIFCTLAVKLYWACSIDRSGEYFSWILADLIALLSIEFVLCLVCFLWQRKAVLRITLIIATVVCTWSVVNAGWLIANGTQALPAVIWPLIRDPVNRFAIVGHHLAMRPMMAVALLGPSAAALILVFMILKNPLPPRHNVRTLIFRIVIYGLLIAVAALANGSCTTETLETMASKELRFNCQFRAITSLLAIHPANGEKVNYKTANRCISTFDEIEMAVSAKTAQARRNIVIIVLEGVAYKQTSLWNESNATTPYLKQLAETGVELTNCRTPATHTTKALFALLTGMYPSISQDFIEAVPAEKPYAAIAEILRKKLGYETAFFQSALGNFEARPGLVHNLGFDKFWARDNLADPNAELGYLASDEFENLNAIEPWLNEVEKPFLLTFLCSVTHDPYEVPAWYDDSEGTIVEKYRKTIAYTDSFIKAFDAKLKEMNLADNTIFCVVGDHGEAFGEHDRFGHGRVPFDEALRIPCIIRASGLVEPGLKITTATCSIDLTPTLLGLLGLDFNKDLFDGINILKQPRAERTLYFATWMNNGSAGYVRANEKVIYDPTNQIITLYDLLNDPNESKPRQIQADSAQPIVDELTAWRKESIIGLIPLSKEAADRRELFGSWVCRVDSRAPSAAWLKPQDLK